MKPTPMTINKSLILAVFLFMGSITAVSSQNLTQTELQVVKDFNSAIDTSNEVTIDKFLKQYPWLLKLTDNHGLFSDYPLKHAWEKKNSSLILRLVKGGTEPTLYA